MENEVEIKRFMAEQLQQGLSLSEIQQLVNDKFKVKMTYMDIRILASELDTIDWKALDPRAQAEAAKKAKGEAEAKAAEAAAPGAEAAEDVPGTAAAPAGQGSTVVELSKIARPGMMLSGTVKFASGSTADWYVDQMGRLGFDKLDGEPTEEDIREFQTELRKVLR